MINKKTLTILLIVMILAAILVPTFALADDFTGSITISSNTAPTIDAFTVTGMTASLTPTSTYSVALTVTDADQLSNVTSIMMVFWYTTDAGDPTDIPTVDQGEGSDSNVLNWIEVWDGDGFSADDLNTTWSATDTAGEPSDTLTTYAFAFDVTVGMEAQEVDPATDTDKWQVAVKVTDADGNTAFMLANNATDTPISMQWYGEMTASAGAGPQWTSGAAGMAYSDTSAAAQVFDDSYTLEIIANGDYTLQTYADTTWSDGTNDITYDIATDAAEEFSIAVDTVSTYNSGTAQELPNDLSDGTNDGHTETISIDTSSAGWGTGTDYDGVMITNIYMFLKTNASMTTTTTNNYTGTVTYILVNN